MRTITVCICVLLAFAVIPSAAQTPVGAQQDNQKVIHDPVEYNAYVTALNTPDPVQKAAAMEAFVEKYPGTVVLEDALEQLLAAYQAAGKPAELKRIADRILELNENNVRALAILVALTRAALTNSGKDQKLPDLRLLAERGIRLLPEMQNRNQMSEPDFEKLKNQMSVIFHSGAGFAALMRKDYAAAREYYTPAVALDPDDLPNTYQLSVADLEMANPDIRGFWYVARAIQLCEKQNNQVCVSAIRRYAVAKYSKFHGSEEGWPEILRRVATSKMPGPPPDFHVTRAAQASTAPDASAASLTSNSSPGNAHHVSASVLSSNRTSAAIPSTAVDPPRGAPASALSSGSDSAASVLSANSPGSGHGVPASVLSVNSPGTAHNVQASVTSSAPRAQGSSSGMAASILHTASASALAVSRGMAALSKSLSSQRVK